MKACNFRMDPRQLEEMLELPSEAKIVGVEWLFVSNQIRFFVIGLGAETAPYASTIEIIPTITQSKDGGYLWDFPDGSNAK